MSSAQDFTMDHRRLKVLFWALEWPGEDHIGGVGRYVFRLAEESKDLVDITVVTFEGARRIDGISFIEIPRPVSRFARFYSVPWRYRKLGRGESFDIVHTHGDDWALSRRCAPRVRTFYGSALSEARASRGLRRWNHVLLYTLEKVSAFRASARVGIAPEAASFFGCEFLMPPVSRIPSVAVRKTNKPSVLFIGTYNGRKRGDSAARIIRGASGALGAPVDFHTVGPEGDQAYWESVSTHHANPSDQEVAELLAGSWILLAPSDYEGFGIPAFEAVSSFTKVVTRSTPGSDYISNHIANSSIFYTGTTDEDLHIALVEMLRSGPAFTSSQTKDARQAVERLLSDGSASRLVNEIYRSLLPSNRRR